MHAAGPLHTYRLGLPSNIQADFIVVIDDDDEAYIWRTFQSSYGSFGPLVWQNSVG